MFESIKKMCTNYPCYKIVRYYEMFLRNIIINQRQILGKYLKQLFEIKKAFFKFQPVNKIERNFKLANLNHKAGKTYIFKDVKY